MKARSLVIGVFCLICCLGVLGCASTTVEQPKIPITTSSDEARTHYREGRELFEKLRFTDARPFFEMATKADPEFAMGHFMLAQTATTTPQFFDSLEQAVALVDGASAGERHQILGFNAGVQSDAAGQRDHFRKLVEAYPYDERAHTNLGTYYFGIQEYGKAVEHLEKAIEINGEFSGPYNMLGYSQRFLGDYAEAESAFRRYIELIPDEANPYDSYAELLMKMGRFEDSIEQYRKALEFNPSFTASLVGIGNNQIFLGRADEARETFAQLTSIARNSGEQRLALQWTALSHVYQGDHGKAITSVEQMYGIAEQDRDLPAMSGDLNLMANILLEDGAADAAWTKFSESLAKIESADVSEDVKEAARRAQLYDQTRVALAKGNVDDARAGAAAYEAKVGLKPVPFEQWRYKELLGRVALAEQRFDEAIAALENANQQDPRVLFLLAQAWRGKGDNQRSREICEKAANYNGLNPNYAYVRNEARTLLEGS